jgi:23S rRNA pseudouridine2604 synthase
MASGVEIMGKLTRKAQTFAVSENPNAFRIILTQGLNRQIRRMCTKLGYNVTQLIRTRIMQLQLGKLEPGQWRKLNDEEVAELLAELQIK